MTHIENKTSRIDGPVRFRPGFRYVGFGRVCRVEVVPALGTRVVNTGQEWLQYVTYRPGSWFVFFSQFGRHYWKETVVATTETSSLVDIAAFQWRQRRTGNLWVRHPFDVWSDYTPGEPYFFDLDHNQAQNATPQSPGFVYLIEATDLNRVRVGWTASPNRRPNELVRHSPSPLNLLALLPGSKLDEAHLQHMLSAVRLHDDWFQLTAQVRTLIDQLKQRWREPDEDPSWPFIDLQTPVGDQGLMR